MSRETIKSCQTVKTCVNAVVVNHAHILKGQPQRKGVSLAIVQRQKLKYVKNVSCVGHLSFVLPVTNVQSGAQDIPVRARLH